MSNFNIDVIENKIQMLKIGKIEFTIYVDNETGAPVIDYMLENMDGKHLVSDCGFDTLEEVLSVITERFVTGK